jgi:hypothetical protein
MIRRLVGFDKNIYRLMRMEAVKMDMSIGALIRLLCQKFLEERGVIKKEEIKDVQ